MKKIIIITLTLFITSCTDKEGATKALLHNGYKPLKVGGYGFFAGSKDDVYVTKFEAVAPNGDTITGCVTKGWFKGSTVRTND